MDNEKEPGGRRAEGSHERRPATVFGEVVQVSGLPTVTAGTPTCISGRSHTRLRQPGDAVGPADRALSGGALLQESSGVMAAVASPRTTAAKCSISRWKQVSPGISRVRDSRWASIRMPAGRKGRSSSRVPLVPPGDPELAARCSSLPPWGRDLFHHLTPRACQSGLVRHTSRLVLMSDQHPLPCWAWVLPAGQPGPRPTAPGRLVAATRQPARGRPARVGPASWCGPATTSMRPFMPRCSVQEYR
jgi:hypothetical protein